MRAQQQKFEQMLPDPNEILDLAIAFRKQNRTLTPGEALAKAFEEKGTTKNDHDQLFYSLLTQVKPEERRRQHREDRSDIFG